MPKTLHTLYMNGLDKPQNLLSDFFDTAFVNQAELLTFDRWDELTARVSERAGVLPIAFLLGDCNPSTPNHWIRQQTKAGKIEYYEMTFRDNPEIYDQETSELTIIGERRVEKLNNLEGMRHKRGYEGVWASSEGLVFEKFSPDIHIIDNFKISKKWRGSLVGGVLLWEGFSTPTVFPCGRPPLLWEGFSTPNLLLVGATSGRDRVRIYRKQVFTPTKLGLEHQKHNPRPPCNPRNPRFRTKNQQNPRFTQLTFKTTTKYSCKIMSNVVS